MTPANKMCACGHERSNHYNAQATDRDIGPCKTKTCDCPRYHGAPT